MPLLIALMTWPTLALVFDTETIAFPSRNYDVFQKLWDVWHGGQFLAGKTSFYHSDVLFYPGGLSLVYENFSLPHMLSVGLLASFLPVSNAYSLTYLLIVFAVALSGYGYLYYLFRDRWLATLGACVFGLSQHVLIHTAHPDINLIVSFPLTLYFFQRGIREGRLRHLVYCGLTVGLTAFLSLYIFICVLITLALLVVCYSFSRWADIRFWLWLPLLCLVIALASAGRLLPILADSEELTSALSKHPNRESGTDLLSYFVNFGHPVTTPILQDLFEVGSPFPRAQTSYLGYLPLALIIIGLLAPGSRRKALPWLGLALPFLLLRLGSVLQIDGQQFSHIVLPKSLLEDLLPPLFSPFHTTDHFQMGILLPLAVMSCYGLKALIESRPANQRALITLTVIAVIAFEYYYAASVRVATAEQLDFIEWLREDSPNQEPRLINLPMGRQPSKFYGFYQTLTGFPQVEGLTGRTPPSAYAYIEGNFLLESWREGESVHCFPPRQSMYLAALDQLVNDGFTHIIWHHKRLGDLASANSVVEAGAAYRANNFVDADPVYRDDNVSIYRLGSLRQSCDLSNFLSPSLLAPLRRLDASPAIIPQQGSAILSILAEAGSDQGDRRMSGAVLFGLHRDTRLTLAAGEVSAQPGADAEAPAADELLAKNSVILLAYDPRAADAEVIGSYRAWLATQFNLCRRLTAADDAIVEYFLKAPFPCELALAASPRAVQYSNGIQLGNLLLKFGESHLDVYLLWTRLPDEAHAVSIQFIDADGARTSGEDFVLSLEPLAHHRIDNSSLPPGDYLVKMILYDYDSGASLPGVEAVGGSSFDRALALGTWTAEQPAQSKQ